MASKKMYQVKVKVSGKGYKNLYMTGLSFAKNPKIAQDMAVTMVKEELSKQPDIAVGNLLIESVKCTLIKQEFILRTA
ncbi:MAG: hypothetical protein GX159_09655 [Flavobacteriaceae bacterium]|jgi:hypothetical protein|nr:hypothetical protein [Flavobacteriaceae bacterium]